MGIAWTILQTIINPLLYGHQLPALSSPLYHWRAYEKWSNSLKRSMCILWLQSVQMLPLLQKKIRLLHTALEMVMACLSHLPSSVSRSWAGSHCFHPPDPMQHPTPPCSLPAWSSSLAASAGATAALASCSVGPAFRRLFALQAWPLSEIFRPILKCLLHPMKTDFVFHSVALGLSPLESSDCPVGRFIPMPIMTQTRTQNAVSIFK